VEHYELIEIFGKNAPARNIAHVFTDEDGEERILRVYQSDQDPANTVKRLREITERIQNHAILPEWVAERRYGVLVLVPTSLQVEPYRRAIARSGLANEIPIQVGLGPTATTLASELRRRSKS
jgi:hypothetical protein